MTSARDWKPKNLGGTIYYDPREELAYWARSAAGLPMVAVPVETLLAAAELHECGATRVATHDEDGELPSPVVLRCRKPVDHPYTGRMHSNGYASWEGQP